MVKRQKLHVRGIQIIAFKKGHSDYLSLTDIARYKDGERSDYVLQNWMRTRSAIEFLGLWEKLNNPTFNSIEFDGIRNEAGLNSFVLTPKKWISKTGAIGVTSKTGRYGGGTYAHLDIAYEFASWISAEFKLYLIKEFQRLKEEESVRLRLGWDVKRIRTDAIKERLIPPSLPQNAESLVYASEADVLNMALFGVTAKMWRDNNPDKEGNIRDYSNVEQLVVLANLEGTNTELIREGLSQPDRLKKLNATAISQVKSLLDNPSVKKLAEKGAD